MTNFFNTEDFSFFRKKINIKDIENFQNNKNSDKINQTKLLQNFSVQNDESIVLAFDDFEGYEIPNLFAEDLDSDNTTEEIVEEEIVEETAETTETETTNNTNDSNADTVNTLKRKLPIWAVEDIEKELSDLQEGSDE